MKESLKNAVKNAICIKYKLTNSERAMYKSNISHVIYNGIVECAVGEYEIDYNN